ncbi:thiolase family protein, partial [candidate division KSB3 bacterium]|nr:thiolase family protein [candidate division KSB3 bacterium]
MAKTNACLVAGGMSTWGLREASLVDVSQEAAKACLDDVPGLNHKDIDGFLYATAFAGRCAFQVNTAPVMAERLGLQPTAICARVDVLCAGGSAGVLLAKGLVESGMADIVMVAGGEKLYTPQKWEIFYSNLASIDHDWDAPHGLGLPPPFFALVAKEHMKRYGTTLEQLAKISTANYNYGANNPKAQFQKNLTMEEALGAPSVVEPLKLYDCCPITDGAAAVIVASEERARELSDRPLVYIRGGAQVSQHSVSANWPGEHLADWAHMKKAAEKAYAKAGVGPDDIDVA